MKRSLIHGILLSCALLSAFVLASCSGIFGGGGGDGNGGGTPTNTVLPNAVMVTVPASLVGDGGAVPSLRALRSSRAVAPDRAEEAYWMIKSGVYMMKSNGASMAMYGAGIDELISSQNLTPQAAPFTEKTMTLTQALVDKMNAFAASGGFEMEDMSAMVGQSMPVPPFYYETASVAPYAYAFRMTETDEYGTFYNGFYWSSDKTKVKMVMSDNESDASDTYRYTVTYDDSTKTSAMIMVADSNSFTFSLKEDTASMKNGAFVFFEASTTFDSDGDTVPETWNQSGTGYADDAGGTLKVTLKTGTGSAAKVQTYETAFNASVVDNALVSNYSGNLASIDSAMYEEIGAASEDAGGGPAEYEMDTKVVPLSGVVVDNNKFYLIFAQRLTWSSGTQIEAGTNVSFPDAVDNIDTATFVGSGYASDAGKLTVFLEKPEATGGYAYVVNYTDGVYLLTYVNSITL